MSEKIVGYAVASGQNLRMLESDVAQYIKLGYQPYGGIGSGGDVWTQAMVKSETQPESRLDGGDAWSEHKDHTRSEWRAEVSNGYTQRGYWDWVQAKLEGA